MSKEQAIRQQMEQRLAHIERRTGRIESHLREPGNPDWTERATEAENDEVLERLGAAGLAELAQIRAALARLDDGRYGLCTRCGSKIEPRRLEALPFTDSCIACAQR